MTHDELLAKIQSKIEQKYLFPWTIIRAAVELHYPLERMGNPVCRECTENAKEGYVVYPCPTIQVIEKELK